MKTAYDQLSELGRDCVAGLIGAEDCAAFRNHLRSMPALDCGWNFGDMADAYLLSRLEYLRKTDAITKE